MEEKDLFLLLIQSSGVGPRLAITILSVFDVDELVHIFIHKDEKKLVTVPGVGKRTAQKIILDLSDNIKKKFGERSAGVAYSTMSTESQAEILAYTEACGALRGLGFKEDAIEKALRQILASYRESKTVIPNTGHLIKAALKNLSI